MEFVSGLLMVLIILTSLFLIVLVMIQRGKGGGLAGAFGGMGGQSAFGTKAGDLFTKITIGVAIFWILLLICAVWAQKYQPGGPLSQNMGGTTELKQSAPPDAATERKSEEGKESAPASTENPPAKEEQK
jgi:preprotein translocase subunit SecG